MNGRYEVEGYVKYNTGIAAWLWFHGYDFQITREWSEKDGRLLKYYLFYNTDELRKCVKDYYEGAKVSMRDYDNEYKYFKQATTDKISEKYYNGKKKS